MESEEAQEFFDRVTSGTKHYKSIELEHKSGAALSDVELHPVDKAELGSVVERLPEAMFAAAEGAENPEEAEEKLEESDELSGLDAMNEDTISAFEDLCKMSLKHEDLAPPQMKQIVAELSIEVLFELGTEIIQMSVEDTGDVQGFRELN